MSGSQHPARSHSVHGCEVIGSIYILDTKPTTQMDYKWLLIAADSSEVEIESFLDRQKRWKKKASQHEACQVCPVRFTEHTMHYAIYVCNSPSCQKSGIPCEWYARTKICDESKRGSIEQHGQHVSSNQDEPTLKLNFTMKRFIRDKVKEKYKPARILNAMIDARLISTNAPLLRLPVARYAHNYRTRGLGDNNDVDQMERLLERRPYHDSLPEDAAFGFAFATDSSGKPTLSRGTATQPVVIGFATKKSIRNLAHAATHMLHVDATFKLNTAGFPSVVIGVSDVRRQFHPVAFFIVSDIRQQQLEAVFRETFKLYHTVTGNIAKIGFTMADADVAQRNALETVIAQDLGQRVPPVHSMCFFHVMQNVHKYISSVPTALRPSVFKHIYRMHYARSEVELDRRSAEAVQAWKSVAALRDFERRFSQQWLAGRFTRWQCFSTPPGYAKTNNPVEQFNKEIKRDYSLRSLVSVNALAQAFLDMCYHRACRAKPFEIAPSPSDKQGKRYRALAKQGRLTVSSHYRASIAFLMECDERRTFRVVQSGADTPKQPRTKALSATEHLDLADTETESDGQPSMGWLVDVDAWTCECRNWRKFGYCVHLIAARLHVDLPVEGIATKRTFEIKGKKRGQGRLPQVGHALSLV